jgi:hypothetical protein
MHRNNFLNRARIIAALLAGMILVPVLRSQPTEETVQSRFLFVFDTSWNMKARLEGTQKALNIMLATSLSGQMHAGDSIGVWTFNHDLHTGQYPLQNWNPDDAVTIASNLVTFVQGQHYAKSTRFEALQPLLNEVMQDSERLTVLIFSDGEGKITGTPFDDAINKILQEKSSAQRKAREPIVILLRSQLGQYVGCTVTLPPQLVYVPQFPLLPEPTPTPTPTNVPPPAPVVIGPPLIIIGTHVGSSQPPVTNPPPAASPVLPPALPGKQTNPPAPPPTASPTNPVAAKIIAIEPTNAPPALPENPGSVKKGFLIVGSGLLGAAIALGMVLWVGSRRKVPSLITRSMNERK